MPLVAMFVSNRYPLPNPAQVFESDCLARYGGFLDEFLADAVVHVLLEAAIHGGAFLRRRRFAFFVPTFCNRWRRRW